MDGGQHQQRRRGQAKRGGLDNDRSHSTQRLIAVPASSLLLWWPPACSTCRIFAETLPMTHLCLLWSAVGCARLPVMRPPLACCFVQQRKQNVDLASVPSLDPLIMHVCAYSKDIYKYTRQRSFILQNPRRTPSASTSFISTAVSPARESSTFEVKVQMTISTMSQG